MGGENYDLVWLFPPANFSNDIFLLYRPANSVRHAEPRTSLAGMCRDGSSKPHRVFPRDHGLRNLVNLPHERIRVPVQQQPFSRARPENCARTALYGSRDDRGRSQIFVEEIGPRRTDFRVRKQQGALDISRSRKFLFAAAADVDNRRFDTASWNCR